MPQAMVRMAILHSCNWSAYPQHAAQDSQGHSSPANHPRKSKQASSFGAPSGVKRQQRPAAPGPPQPSGLCCKALACRQQCRPESPKPTDLHGRWRWTAETSLVAQAPCFRRERLPGLVLQRIRFLVSHMLRGHLSSRVIDSPLVEQLLTTSSRAMFAYTCVRVRVTSATVGPSARVCRMPIRMSHRPLAKGMHPTSCRAVTPRRSSTAERSFAGDIKIAVAEKKYEASSGDRRQHEGLWQQIARAMWSTMSVGMLAMLLVRHRSAGAPTPSLPQHALCQASAG